MSQVSSLLSSNAIPITRGSKLRIQGWNPIGAQEIFNIRTLIEDISGNIIEGFDQLAVPTASSTANKLLSLTDGRLISVTISSTNATANRGSFYAIAELIRGDVIDASSRLLLAAGYLDASHSVNYPLGTIDDMNSGDGVINALGSNTPAAGAEIQFATSTTIRIKLRGGKFRLVTSAAVATRTVAFAGSRNSVDIFRVTARTTQLASLTRDYWLWIGENMPADVGQDIYLPIPNDLDSDQISLTTATTNIQAGDQFSASGLLNEARIYNT